MSEHVDPPGSFEERALKAEAALSRIFTVLADGEQKVVDLCWDPATSDNYLLMAQTNNSTLDRAMDVIMDLYEDVDWIDDDA